MRSERGTVLPAAVRYQPGVLPEAKAPQRRTSVSVPLSDNAELLFCFIMILKAQYVCSVLSQKTKTQAERV